MWLMASEIPVRLEILDQIGQRLFGAAAKLTSLDESHALLALEEPLSAAQLHWGSPVRFEVEDGLRRYEITGAIVERQEEDRAADAVEEASRNSRIWEIRVRLWECKLNVQRRALPRRKLRLPVSFRIMCGEEPLNGGLEAPPEVVKGWCVDIGAGGIRVRTQRLETVPTRVHLEFRMPVSDGVHGMDTVHQFCMAGRVIRAEPHGRYSDGMELAIRFEHISVRDGMVLRNLLN